MQIQHQDTSEKGVFFINDENEHRIAELTYFWNQTNVFSIDHTWIDDSLRGQGVAKILFNKAIHFARDKNVKIIPICSYASAMFQRDSSLADVLYIDKLANP